MLKVILEINKYTKEISIKIDKDKDKERKTNRFAIIIFYDYGIYIYHTNSIFTLIFF